MGPGRQADMGHLTLAATTTLAASGCWSPGHSVAGGWYGKTFGCQASVAAK